MSPLLRVLAVDDEPPALDEVAYLLGRDERVGDVLTCASATEALRVLRTERIHVVLLDVAMPGLTGLELAEVLRQFRDPPAVIFVTAHEHHAVDAFELQAVDYILKPVRVERLREAIRRVADGSESGGVAGDSDEQVPVDLGGVIRFVRRSEVRYASAQGDYVRLHTGTDSPLVRMPLGTLADRWSSTGFVRIHRSILIALAYLDEVRLEPGRSVVVVDGVELPVSRRHVPEVRVLMRRSRVGDL